MGDVATVDSFQGRQAPLVLLNVVAGKVESSSSKESSDSVKQTMLDAHARDQHRLCVAITRAEYDLIIFERSRLLIQSRNTAVAVSKMITSARARLSRHNDAGQPSRGNRTASTVDRSHQARRREYG